MCRATPGRIVETSTSAAGLRMGKVRFSDTVREVCLEVVPDAEVGDYVVVHTGFAVSRFTEEKAKQVLKMIGEVDHPTAAGG